MKLRTLSIRAKNLLLNPASEYERIAGEQEDIRSINRGYVLPVAALISIFALIGSAFSSITSPVNSLIYVGINTVIVFLLMIAHCYLSGKLIGVLGRNIDADSNSSNIYGLALYSQLPFFMIFALTKLFPSLIFLLVLGLYSGLLFYTGIPVFTRIHGNKRIQFTLVSILIMLMSFILSSELFTFIYSEILEQITTFVA